MTHVGFAWLDCAGNGEQERVKISDLLGKLLPLVS